MKSIYHLNLSEKSVFAFDLDGTLIDTTMFWREVEQRIIQQRTGKNVPLQILSDNFTRFMDFNSGSSCYNDYWQSLCDHHQLDLSLEEYVSIQDDTASLHMANIKYKNQAPEAPMAIKHAGHQPALATASSAKDLDFYLQNQNIRDEAHFKDFFNHTFTKDDVVHSKPHPEVYQRVLSQFNIKASQCIVFEDSLRGVRAAKEAGIEVVHVHDEVSTKDIIEISAIADYHTDSFGEFLAHFKKKKAPNSAYGEAQGLSST